MIWPRALSILWLPGFLAIALPVTLQVAVDQSAAHKPPITADANAWRSRPFRTTAAAAHGFRDSKIAARYAAGSTAIIYVADAASAIGAGSVRRVFARGATAPGRMERARGLALPLESGDGGIGVFFLVFPLMLSGVITAIVLRQRPTWGIGRQVVLVGTVGAVSSLAAYLSAVGLHVVPAKPLLLCSAFLITQLASAQFLGQAHSRGQGARVARHE
jgi:hypothetical protein